MLHESDKAWQFGPIIQPHLCENNAIEDALQTVHVRPQAEPDNQTVLLQFLHYLHRLVVVGDPHHLYVHHIIQYRPAKHCDVQLGPADSCHQLSQDLAKLLLLLLEANQQKPCPMVSERLKDVHGLELQVVQQEALPPLGADPVAGRCRRPQIDGYGGSRK